MNKATAFEINLICCKKESVRTGMSRIFRLCFRLINSSMLGILDI